MKFRLLRNGRFPDWRALIEIGDGGLALDYMVTAPATLVCISLYSPRQVWSIHILPRLGYSRFPLAGQ